MLFRTVGHMLSLRVLHVSRVSNGKGVSRICKVDRGAARFCPNMSEHCHFYCDACAGVFDIGLPAKTGLPLPKGFKAERFDIAIHGRCPACASRKK